MYRLISVKKTFLYISFRAFEKRFSAEASGSEETTLVKRKEKFLSLEQLKSFL